MNKIYLAFCVNSPHTVPKFLWASNEKPFSLLKKHYHCGINRNIFQPVYKPMACKKAKSSLYICTRTRLFSTQARNISVYVLSKSHLQSNVCKSSATNEDTKIPESTTVNKNGNKER